MPNAKLKTKSQRAKVTKPKTTVQSEGQDIEGEPIISSSVSTSPLAKLSGMKGNKFIYLAIIIIVLALLISYKKSWFIAATVNGSPISNFAVLNEENNQYRKQTIDQLVNEKLILSEANKKGVKVSEKDIDTKIAEIEKQVGGASALDSLLAQQGQTRIGIRGQIKITLSLEKMYESESSVSADEVTKFIEQNKNQLQSSTPAEMTKEATDALKSQKLNQIFSQKFQEIKKAANIQIF